MAGGGGTYDRRAILKSISAGIIDDDSLSCRGGLGATDSDLIDSRIDRCLAMIQSWLGRE
jgi:hypothetical protein